MRHELIVTTAATAVIVARAAGPAVSRAAPAKPAVVKVNQGGRAASDKASRRSPPQVR